jgi:maltooligosyltrehalose trehalohydrolase
MSIHSPYGTPDDLRRFIDRAHQLGIAVKIDLVLNHG